MKQKNLYLITMFLLSIAVHLQAQTDSSAAINLQNTLPVKEVTNTFGLAMGAQSALGKRLVLDWSLHLKSSIREILIY